MLAVPFIIPVILVRYYTHSPYIVIISAGLTFIGYYLYVYFKDPQLRNLVKMLKQ